MTVEFHDEQADPSRSSDAVLRIGTAGDVPAVLDLWNTAYSVETPRADGSSDVERLVEYPGGDVAIAEIDEVMVGALIVAWDGWRGNMYRLAVLPEYRRRGVALSLVRFGLDWLEAVGARRVTSWVSHQDTAAVELWRSAGYELDARMSRFVFDL